MHRPDKQQFYPGTSPAEMLICPQNTRVRSPPRSSSGSGRPRARRPAALSRGHSVLTHRAPRLLEGDARAGSQARVALCCGCVAASSKTHRTIHGTTAPEQWLAGEEGRGLGHLASPGWASLGPARVGWQRSLHWVDLGNGILKIRAFQCMQVNSQMKQNVQTLNSLMISMLGRCRECTDICTLGSE